MDPLVGGAMHFLLRPDDHLFGYRSSMFFLFSNAIFRGSRAFILAISCKRGTRSIAQFNDHDYSKHCIRRNQLVTSGPKRTSRSIAATRSAVVDYMTSWIFLSTLLLLRHIHQTISKETFPSHPASSPHPFPSGSLS
jgi:hypothetical protein